MVEIENVINTYNVLDDLEFQKSEVSRLQDLAEMQARKLVKFEAVALRRRHQVERLRAEVERMRSHNPISEGMVHELAELRVENDRFRDSIDCREWLCKACNTVYPESSLNNGPRSLLCPGCGAPEIRPREAWRIADLEAENARLQSVLESVCIAADKVISNTFDHEIHLHPAGVAHREIRKALRVMGYSTKGEWTSRHMIEMQRKARAALEPVPFTPVEGIPPISVPAGTEPAKVGEEWTFRWTGSEWQFDRKLADGEAAPQSPEVDDESI